MALSQMEKGKGHMSRKDAMLRVGEAPRCSQLHAGQPNTWAITSLQALCLYYHVWMGECEQSRWICGAGVVFLTTRRWLAKPHAQRAGGVQKIYAVPHSPLISNSATMQMRRRKKRRQREVEWTGMIRFGSHHRVTSETDHTIATSLL